MCRFGVERHSEDGAPWKRNCNGCCKVSVRRWSRRSRTPPRSTTACASCRRRGTRCTWWSTAGAAPPRGAARSPRDRRRSTATAPATAEVGSLQGRRSHLPDRRQRSAVPALDRHRPHAQESRATRQVLIAASPRRADRFVSGTDARAQARSRSRQIKRDVASGPLAVAPIAPQSLDRRSGCRPRWWRSPRRRRRRARAAPPARGRGVAGGPRRARGSPSSLPARRATCSATSGPTS